MNLDPRANQKARTRNAIVAAAGQLITAGKRPTVAEAAEAALVSRATAYRYFPTQESLLLEAAAVTPAAEPVEQALAAMTDPDPALRLSRTIALSHAMFCENEASMRLALRTYLDAWLDSAGKGGTPVPVELREGRRKRWIELAVGTVLEQLSPQNALQLRSALALTVGIESLVVMRDVCGLSTEDSHAVLSWAAQSLLAQALREEAADSDNTL